ncbi:hypothetical protein [Erythrobacter sp. THAF29]|uniref:DUF7010 family protein n=1 Tax=Erythrobacter sp. THAF29 TaxID=2587851 RepID=UPI001267F72D|nr:hypothetical protein [Erythrobacter sp. THAF29]QFT78096.1 hypothetical protein FIU90_11155 [Erythrobacter sp. THAF29]
MDIAAAQADLRRAYADGGPGVFISGLVWLVAAVIEARDGVATGFVVLFIGGVFIYPLALFVNRTIFRRTSESKGNPGGMLVLESTIAMIAGLFAAWLFLDYNPDLVMPLAAIMVGTHYFTFKTAYGDRIFWLLAAIVTMVGAAGIYRFMPLPLPVTYMVAIIELIFGAAMTVKAVRNA